jgi:hypothetical protein
MNVQVACTIYGKLAWSMPGDTRPITYQLAANLTI